MRPEDNVVCKYNHAELWTGSNTKIEMEPKAVQAKRGSRGIAA
jgi:hypothetical protein